MTYEKAVLVQAELRTVRGSTNERKHISTKTTFKRTALVTVAALGFGMVASVSPAKVSFQNLGLNQRPLARSLK